MLRFEWSAEKVKVETVWTLHIMLQCLTLGVVLWLDASPHRVQYIGNAEGLQFPEVVGDRPEKMSATLLTCSQRWVYRLRALIHFQKKRLTPMWGNKREKRTTSSRKRKRAMQRWDSFKDTCARRVWKGVGSAVRKTYSYPICWREDRTYFCQSQKHNYFSRPKVENKHGLEGVARQKLSWYMVHFFRRTKQSQVIHKH